MGGAQKRTKERKKGGRLREGGLENRYQSEVGFNAAA